MLDRIMALLWIVGLFIAAGFLATALINVHARLTDKKEKR